MKKNSLLFNCILTSILCALSLAMMIFVKIPLSAGYIHPGDFVLFLSSCILPRPYALICSIFSGSFADIINGFPLYAVPTAFIKCSEVLLFTSKKDRIFCRKNFTASVISMFITAFLYFVTDVIILSYGKSTGFNDFFNDLTSKPILISACTSLPFNAVQGFISVLLFILSGKSLDRIDFKARFIKGGL